jgi:predicted small lipoprotein YifL
MKALSMMAVVALLLASLAGLAGCGQKGPLYLPDDEPAAEQPSGQSS